MKIKGSTSILPLLLLILNTGYSQPWLEHGQLKVSQNGHFLVHEDGNMFFWSGDTPWALFTLDEREVEEYLADRASRDFNVIQLMTTRVKSKTFGYATLPGLNGQYLQMNAYGEIPLKSVRPVALNDKFWDHMEYIVDRAADYGIYTAIVVMWGRSADKLFPDPLKDNFEYGRLIAERFRDKPNVIWVASGELYTINQGGKDKYLSEEQVSLLSAIGRGLKAGAGENQLITIHGQGEWHRMPSTYFHNEEWLDFHMNQSWDRICFIDSMMVNDWNLDNPKPTLLSEAKYEGSFYPHYTLNAAKGDYCSDWHVRLQAYWSVFSGGFGHTYGALGLWNCDGILDKKILEYPGADDMRHLKNLFESKPSLTRVYDNSFINRNTTDDRNQLDVVLGTWDKSRTWAFVYTSQGSKITVDLGKFDAKYLYASWYDPRIGVYRNIGKFQAKGEMDFDPPGVRNKKVYKGADWILVLDNNP